jgi:ABC-type Fe3+ transport system permease subunit/DNA-binding beta-propeller fold protein YncE
VKDSPIYIKFLKVVSTAPWIILILLPLAVLFISAIGSSTEIETGVRIYSSLFNSVCFSALIAAASILLGWIPGRLLGSCSNHKDLLLFGLLLPLVLPRYVLYYTWTLLTSPTTALGAYLSGRTELARFTAAISCAVVFIMWYWPLAALLLAQGWRKIDRQLWDSAAIDANRFETFGKITLPLLGRAIFLAYSVCFVLSVSDFATFHLAGVSTIGTELAVLYELTGSEAALARAAWPVAVIALIAALAVGKTTSTWSLVSSPVGHAKFKPAKWQLSVLFTLIGISLLTPILILVGNIQDTQAFRQFFTLHLDEFAWSLAIAAVAALTAFIIALAVLSLEKHKLLSLIAGTSLFFIMFIPPSLFAVALLKTLIFFNAPVSVSQSWYVVSAGQAGQFAGIALILILLSRHAHEKDLSEMASLDGASQIQIFRYIYLPQTWPLFLGGFILIMMFSVIELSATMILLPAGLPNFAQRLLNQMHYARDQHVIVSCLALIGTFAVLAAVVVLLLRTLRLRQQWLVLAACVCLFVPAGCHKAGSENKPKVLAVFGRTGQGHCEFIYPRAIDIADDGTLFIVDKTGRIQRLNSDGKFLGVFKMPLTESGKPTGLSIGPDGNLYVADTHYHRIIVFSPEGQIIRQWGSFGRENDCFIYPTDVAFSGDGRIFVSEYGGNDRISVFNEQGDFLYSFGSPGSDNGQFARPSAVCVDDSSGRLYVADACNHRIGIYNLDGQLLGYIGRAGNAAGELRYPYDLALLDDGTLVVCEYGNNRIQLFSPEGKSLAVYGRAGRQPAELAYPWGLAIDKRHCAYIVDAGNNRIQVWQL